MRKPNGVRILTETETNVAEVIRSAMKARGYTLKMLADAMGYSSPSGIANMLLRENVMTNTLAVMMDVLGFDIVIKDRNGSNRENTWKLGLTDGGRGAVGSGGAGHTGTVGSIGSDGSDGSGAVE